MFINIDCGLREHHGGITNIHFFAYLRVSKTTILYLDSHGVSATRFQLEFPKCLFVFKKFPTV